MKSVLPLIIAFVLIGMLSIATLYYVTGVITYNTNIYMNQAYGTEWRALEEEVRSILLTILRKYSYYAVQQFNTTFMNNYEDEGFQENPDPESRVTRKVMVRTDHKKTTIINEYVKYNYGDFSSTYTYCYVTHDPNSLYELNLEGYSASRNDYLDAIYRASIDASTVLTEYTYTVMNRWIDIREDLGYRIYIIDINSYFNTTLASNPYNGSIGTTRMGTNVVLDVYSPWSGYKRVNETVEILFKVIFKEGFRNDTSFYLPIRVYAYISIGNENISYIIDPDNVTTILYSKMFHRMSELEYIPGNLDKIVLDKIKEYYSGEGETIIYYTFNTRTNIPEYVFNSIIYNMSLSDPTYDDEFRIPCSEKDYQKLPKRIQEFPPRHTMTFFIGGLVYANIDGIYVVTPLQIVYSYLFDTQPQNYDWSYSDYIVGDIGQV
ncbi:MAG: hypothetical protein J7L82_01605, partial [Staphylothermus sp.]|nr:hypothetical protein [Staphylothermus sp.]